MKTKFYSILLTALFGFWGMNVWAQSLDVVEIDGINYYQVTCAEDLAALSQIVNGGETTANAILTEDIDMADMIDMDGWTAIGDWSTGAVTSAYCGHFDGQGHKITGFNATSSHNYYGIFGVVSTGCLIENFSIYGTLNLGHKTGGVVGYTRDATPTIRNIHSYLTINVTEEATTAQRPGGIVGSAVNGTTVIENCSYSGTLNVGGHTGNIGGIVGYVNNNTKAIVNITNCLFDGKILNGTTAEGQCGGIVGYNNSGVVTIKNCLSIGTIETKEGNDGMFFGRLNAGNSTFINNYYVGENINGTAGSGTAKGTTPVKVNETQLMSGAICFALNDDQTEINWFQNLSTDDYPTPFGTDVVYPAGKQHCDGTAYEGVSGYSNTPSAMDDHTFADGFCTYCGAFNEAYMTPNEEGYFELGTANELKWFAFYVNKVNPAVNAILTADIDMTGVEWTPIGKGVSYGGTFDGKDFTISNFSYIGSGDYNGLFGKIVDATIKNFKINGTLNCAGTGSGVIGWSEGSAISNIHSSLMIEATDGTLHHAGGVIGGARNGGTNGGTTMQYCSFTGTMKVNAASNDCFGGIAGYTNEYCIFNSCANYGKLTYENPNGYVGGIIGYVNNANCYGAHNCLNVGDIIYDGEGDPVYGGAIVGRLRNNNPAIWGENYWKQGSAAQANGENQLSTNYEVTDGQLASGEVAAKLAPYFRQNIGTDETPVLDPAHNVVAEITAAGYATLYVPNTDVAVPEGVEAFAGVVLKEGWLHLNAIEGGKIAAGEPVILQGAAGYYSFAPTTGATKAAENILKGTDEDADGTGKYILAMPEGEEIGFYKAVSGTIIKAGKAYLESTSGVKAFYFDVDDATGIENIEHSTLNIENSIYDLSGRKINVQLPKGIYIVNGKKVLK